MIKVNPIIFIIVVGLILWGMFLLLKPKNAALQPASPSEAAKISTKTVELVIKNKKVISGPETITVTKGDQVTIKITPDQDEEFHLHGYDKSVDLERDKQSQLSLTANLTGRFVMELEKSKTDIGALEVLPK